MTTADAEPVAGPSHGNSQVMQMTSGLHLYQSQQLQLVPVVCLPVSVQQLTYEDGQFHEDDDDADDDGGDDGDDGTEAHGSQLVSVNSSHESRKRQNLTSSYASTTV